MKKYHLHQGSIQERCFFTEFITNIISIFHDLELYYTVEGIDRKLSLNSIQFTVSKEETYKQLFFSKQNVADILVGKKKMTSRTYVGFRSWKCSLRGAEKKVEEACIPKTVISPL